MKAMILAAGYGARLWPLTADRTKPALPVLGKPLVGYVAEYLAQQGIEDAIVNLHHRPESVRAALGDGSQFGIRLQYVHEPQILGTSGALDNAREMIGTDTFVVINGKLITDIDLRSAIETHRKTIALATLVLRKNATRERFSIVETSDGFVTRFAGMPEPASPEAVENAPLMFTGIQIMESRIFNYIPPGVFSHSTVDVFPRAIAKGERIAAHIADGMWFELSTLERYLDISLALLSQRGLDLHTGNNVSIDPQADVRESILWNEATVEAGAKVHRAILGDGVRVRSGEVVENVAVVRADLVAGITPPAKAPKGYVKGDTFVVPLSQ